MVAETPKHDEMTAECASGDGASFYASMYPGDVLSIEAFNADGRMIEIELRPEDAAKLAELIKRNTQ